jgi:hypothetical protein
MDTPSYTLPPVPARTTTLSLGQRPAVIVGSVIVLLALVIGGAYWAWNNRSGGPGEGGYVLAATAFPPYAARHLDGTLEPLTVDGQGSATLYDVVETEMHAYYLLSGPEANQSTLYRRDLAGAGLEQLTTSPGLKIDLSMLAGGGVLAYTVQDAPGGATRVVAWEENTKEETSLGEGSEPTLLGDGRHVLFRRGGSIVSADIADGMVAELAPAAQGAPFAADRATGQFAVYDPTEHVIKSYWIENMTTSVPGLVTPVTDAPHALFYDHVGLRIARMEGDTLVITTLDGARTQEVAAPGLSLTGLSLTYHD